MQRVLVLSVPMISINGIAIIICIDKNPRIIRLPQTGRENCYFLAGFLVENDGYWIRHYTFVFGEEDDSFSCFGTSNF